MYVKNAGDYPWGSVQAPGACIVFVLRRCPRCACGLDCLSCATSHNQSTYHPCPIHTIHLHTTDWALPVAAIATLSFGVLIPLILKPGVDSFNAGGAVGAEKKAAQAGLQPATKIGAKKPVAKPAAKAGPAKAAGKVMAKGGAVAKGGAKAAAAAAPAPKKKGWF